ncbi:hypothetical protein MUP37_04505, partial [Candidatus Bathyarchaeota archaeon]|nr:hypothetical protein [Candidatus Bathyarchaeota archaeon]
LTVGNRHYWIKISNDSSGTWIEGAFGRQGENQDQSFRVYLSAKLAATGIFEGVQEFAFLHCFIDDHVPVLVLGMQG